MIIRVSVFTLLSLIALSGPADAQKKMSARSVLVGECNYVAPPTKGACGRSVILVSFEDGYMSIQFHSADRFTNGRYREVTSLVGPGLKDTSDKNILVLPLTEYHVLDGARRRLSSPKFASGECRIKFENAENLQTHQIRSIECALRNDKDQSTFSLLGAKPGTERDL